MARRNVGPGFHAEAALSQTMGQYCTAGSSFSDTSADLIVPQRAAGGLSGGIGVGGILTDFGCYLNYSFCLLGCAWEWLKWTAVDPALGNSLGSLCVAECDVDLMRCKGGLPPEPGIP